MAGVVRQRSRRDDTVLPKQRKEYLPLKYGESEEMAGQSLPLSLLEKLSSDFMMIEIFPRMLSADQQLLRGDSYTIGYALAWGRAYARVFSRI